MPKATITCNTIDAKVRYTLDNSDVTEQSTLYEGGEITLSYGQTIKARAFKLGMNPSGQASLSAFQKLQTPELSLSRKGITVNGVISNTVEGAVYLYKLGTAPQNMTDGTVISNNTFTFSNEEAVTVYIKGFYYGYYNPSDTVNKEINQFDRTISLHMKLYDNSTLIYDRGEEYGEYQINDDGELIRVSSGTDDGSADSANWRYLICEEYDLAHYVPTLSSESIPEQHIEDAAWGNYNNLIGTVTRIGGGLYNSNRSGTGDIDPVPLVTPNIWSYINKHKIDTGINWFLPSKDELNIIYENRNYINNLNFETGSSSLSNDSNYASSSEENSYDIYIMYFSSGEFSTFTKRTMIDNLRLLRRI